MARTARKPAKNAKKRKPARQKSRPPARLSGGLRFLLRWAVRLLGGAALLVLVLIVLFRFVNPPLTHTIWVERSRLGSVEHRWVPIEEVAPAAVRAVVAAEDANFCTHWGFDMKAIRAAIDEGGSRGASTISQQTVKNVFLWQGRSWPRKALEAAITLVVEMAWPKRRILEVYLNVAEFGEGVFGIDAAARRYYGVSAARLSPAQGARLAVLLPNPRQRDPVRLPAWLRKRAAQVQDGAATIKADGRSSCFES